MDVRSLAYEHADVILCFPIGAKDGNFMTACNAAFKRWGAELRAVSQMRLLLRVGTKEDRLSASERSRARAAGEALAATCMCNVRPKTALVSRRSRPKLRASAR